MGKGKDVLWGEDVSSRMEEEKGLGRRPSLRRRCVFGDMGLGRI